MVVLRAFFGDQGFGRRAQHLPITGGTGAHKGYQEVATCHFSINQNSYRFAESYKEFRGVSCPQITLWPYPAVASLPLPEAQLPYPRFCFVRASLSSEFMACPSSG